MNLDYSQVIIATFNSLAVSWSAHVLGTMKTTLFHFDSFDTWLDDLPGALGSLGYSVRQERRGLFAYEETVPTSLEGVVRADGFLVVREPLEQGEVAPWGEGSQEVLSRVVGRTGPQARTGPFCRFAAGLPSPAWTGAGKRSLGGRAGDSSGLCRFPG